MFEQSTSDARTGEQTHRCIAAGSCRAQVFEDGERQPAFTEKHHTLCPGCIEFHRGAIRRLPNDYAMLRATLGEHQARQGDLVSSSRSAAVPIDATSDRFMTEIVEWANFAADIVSGALNTATPDGGRKLAAIRLDDGTVSGPRPDTIAERTWEQTKPPEADRLAAYIAIVEPHIERLSAEPVQEVQIWAQPKRCPDHTVEVASAKRLLELARTVHDSDEISEATDRLQAVFTAAGACDECCGWGKGGQARQDVQLSGLDVLNRLTRTHQLIRKHLGQTKLRHRYAMPCPRCGYSVGRDDGTNIVTCENPSCIKTGGKWGPSSWTEREYQFLADMVGDDERTITTSKYLLAEGYSRLDRVQVLINKVSGDDVINRPGAGQIILDALTRIIDGHLKPADRKIATDKAAAQKRQTVEDTWAWRNETTYKPPKRKPKPAPRTDIPRIAASSLSTVTDIDLSTNGRPACNKCNLVHPEGECP